MADYAMMRRYLDMVTSGQIAEAGRFYADDVQVHVRGHNMASGDYLGSADYNAAMARITDAVDSFRVEEHDLLVSDDHAVVLSTWYITRGVETAALNHVVVYHTEGDRISEIWIIPEDSEQEAAVLGE